MSIPRYDIYCDYGRSLIADEEPDGMWVKYDDHVAEVKRLTAALDAEKKAHEATTAAALRAHFPDPSADLAAARAERDGLAKALRAIISHYDDTDTADHRPLDNAMEAARAALAALPTKGADDA